jgi:hypothetical protein
MPSTVPPPRLYCLLATEAPVAAVFRRGPSDWCQVGRWDLAAQRYEPGGWLRGRIFPRRSDLSPDGRWLCYFAHKPNADWEHGETYIAVSKLPWLTALHAVGTCGTWTRGYHFTPCNQGTSPSDRPLPIPYSLVPIAITQFANELRRGWVEAPDSPPRSQGGPWDENRNARLHKLQPGGPWRLRVESVGWAGGEFGVEQSIDGLRVTYALESEGDIQLLDDVQWADWDAQGRLLVATRSGQLQIRDLPQSPQQVTWEIDLAGEQPAPTVAPVWAQHW